jgi:hypothetical protein
MARSNMFFTFKQETMLGEHSIAKDVPPSSPPSLLRLSEGLPDVQEKSAAFQVAVGDFIAESKLNKELQRNIKIFASVYITPDHEKQSPALQLLDSPKKHIQSFIKKVLQTNIFRNLEANFIWCVCRALFDAKEIKEITAFQLDQLNEKTSQWCNKRGWSCKDFYCFYVEVLPEIIMYLLGLKQLKSVEQEIIKIAVNQKWCGCEEIAAEYLIEVIGVEKLQGFAIGYSEISSNSFLKNG